MRRIKEGGSAFPLPENWCTHGMTQRDYFAAQALAGLLASLPIERDVDHARLAEVSFLIADAMLAARDQ